MITEREKSMVSLKAKAKDLVKERNALAKKYAELRRELFLAFKALADSQNEVLHIQEDLRTAGLNREACISMLQLPEDVKYWAACGLMSPEAAEYYSCVMDKNISSSYEISRHCLRRCGTALVFGRDDLTPEQVQEGSE